MSFLNSLLSGLIVTNPIRCLQETQDKPSANRLKAKSNSKSVTTPASGTGVWPAAVGIHRVVWNCGNGLSNASLLGSATASGICRVDWLEGRWMKGKIPYRSIENIRKENVDIDGADDEAEEDELEEED